MQKHYAHAWVYQHESGCNKAEGINHVNILIAIF